MDKKKITPAIVIIIIVGLVIIDAILLGYVYTNFSSLNITPSNKVNNLAIPLYFPYSGPVFESGGGSGTFFTIYLNVTFTYTGILQEKTPVTMDIIDGSINPQNESVPYMAPLAVGVQGAVVTRSALFSTPPSVPVNIQGNISSGGRLVSLNAVNIYWDVAGDYSPTLTVRMSNETSPITYVFTEYQIHVNSADVVDQLSFSKVNIVLSIALVVFAFIESGKLIGDVIPQEWKDKLLQREREKHGEILEEVKKIKAKVDKISEKQDRISQSQSDKSKQKERHG